MSADPIVLLVPNLFFRSKIETAARRAGLRVANAADRPAAETLVEEGAAALIVDLGAEGLADPLGLLAWMREEPDRAAMPTLGFLSHVRDDLAKAAREAGCGRVLAKSAFATDLPGHLRRLVDPNQPDAGPLTEA